MKRVNEMNLFVNLGIALVVGIICGEIFRKLKIPMVAGYILAGLVLGVSGLHVVTKETIDSLSLLSDFALGLIAFNIGSELKFDTIKVLGKSIFIIALFEAIGAFAIVTVVMLILGVSTPTAIILGAVASATAPAATVMVLKECKAKGPLTSTLLGVVAIDDAICLMIFAVATSIAKVIVNHGTMSIYNVLIMPLKEIGLSLIVGALFGVILTALIKRAARSKEENLTFTVGTIFVVLGLANVFHLSALLSCMSLGIVVANMCKYEGKVFKNIERFSPPIYAAFFILAGARLDTGLLPQIGIVGIGYFIFRIIGKVAGAKFGGRIAHAPKEVTNNIGFGLLSQVGVAVGLAITVSHEFAGTNIGDMVLTILLATTIMTEIVGPIATKRAVCNANEVEQAS